MPEAQDDEFVQALLEAMSAPLDPDDTPSAYLCCFVTHAEPFDVDAKD